MASLSMRGIQKRYPNGVIAVSDFNLEISDKEFIIFAGPSGCGKSTALRVIAGLEDITAGELYIGDRLMNNVMPRDRDIAMVFQNCALYPHMTAFDNMAFGLKLRRIPKDEINRRVLKAARVLDIENLLDRRPKALSGGQRQRVAMGRAIVREPKVFLMDEPLSNLDAMLRVQMRTEISKLHQRLEATFIYVTHDQAEAMTLGTRIVLLKDGVIQQADTPQNLYHKPVNLFVAGFIGSPKMNFINARAVRDGGGVYLHFGKHRIKLTESKARALLDGGYPDKEVIMGVRPEDLRAEESFVANSRDTAIDAEVEATEMLGADAFLRLNCAGHSLTARTDPSSAAKAHDVIRVALDADRIHIIDKDTETAVVHQGP